MVFGDPLEPALLLRISENQQVDFEDNMSLNLGQILSIPLFLAGIFVLVRSYRQPSKEKTETPGIDKVS